MGAVRTIGNGTAALREAASSAELLEQYRKVRQFTHYLVEPLAIEDYVIQSMNDASPTRWHLAHTTWFFETLALKNALVDYTPFHPQFEYLFNSYYNAVGPQFPRPRRGMLSRPTVAQVYEYRRHVDAKMEALLSRTESSKAQAEVGSVVFLGLQHEQQHQELIVTDLKHMLSGNPLFPVYRELEAVPSAPRVPKLRWHAFEEGLRWIGTEGEGFFYDNEWPRHKTFLHAYELASRLVTNGEYLQFMEDGGYRRPELWLSEGWATVNEQCWEHPLYWRRIEGKWHEFTLGGLRALDPVEPVCHISLFEADAYARWAGARLPLEAEWEAAAQDLPLQGNFVESGAFHPLPPETDDENLQQIYGDVWEWTQSPYVPYPGYTAAAGAVGEYNGKFMCNQYVLRGGSCATSQSHIRPTYRNFFPASARWQFSGIRLARD